MILSSVRPFTTYLQNAYCTYCSLFNPFSIDKYWHFQLHPNAFFFFLNWDAMSFYCAIFKKKLERFQKDNGRVKSPAIYLFVPIFNLSTIICSSKYMYLLIAYSDRGILNHACNKEPAGSQGLSVSLLDECCAWKFDEMCVEKEDNIGSVWSKRRSILCVRWQK